MNILDNNWLYTHSHNNTVRYILGTKGLHPLICIGINPSTAEPNNLDNTLKSVERLALSNSYDSWIMLNVYPQRATNPNDLHKTINTSIHKENINQISNLLQSIQNPTIWGAWGTLINKRPYLLKCLKDIYTTSQSYNCKWVSIGKRTKQGHPHHPLYLCSKSTPEQFDMDDYIFFK
jgi:hypothetical protein